MMDELEEKDLWIAVWEFSGPGGKETEVSLDIKYLNVFPGEKIFSIREDEVRKPYIVTSCFGLIFIRTGSTDI